MSMQVVKQEQKKLRNKVALIFILPQQIYCSRYSSDPANVVLCNPLGSAGSQTCKKSFATHEHVYVLPCPLHNR